MSKDKTFNVGVNQLSDRAMSAANAAKKAGGKQSVQMAGDEPTAPNVPGDSLKRSKQTVLPTMTKPAVQATPPNMVNPMNRPGQGANKSNKKG